MERYMISDAAKLVNVESHVLRYWEEELELEVHRNQLGHRYYTSEDIKLFISVKELKKRGIGLKAIKDMVPELRAHKDINDLVKIPVAIQRPNVPSATNNTDKMAQFQFFLKEAVSQALKENGRQMSKEIGVEVSDKVLKEMDYLMKVQDERDEERYKKLDEVIRNCQRTRQEIAATSDKEKKNKKFWNKKSRKE